MNDEIRQDGGKIYIKRRVREKLLLVDPLEISHVADGSPHDLFEDWMGILVF
jgi:hypothetical protein